MPVRIEDVFDGFIRDCLQSRLNFGPQFYQLRIYENDAIVPREDADVTHSGLNSGALQHVDILGELLHLNLSLAEIWRLLRGLLRQGCNARDKQHNESKS